MALVVVQLQDANDQQLALIRWHFRLLTFQSLQMDLGAFANHFYDW